jgi:hypothetical protein
MGSFGEGAIQVIILLDRNCHRAKDFECGEGLI